MMIVDHEHLFIWPLLPASFGADKSLCSCCPRSASSTDRAEASQESEKQNQLRKFYCCKTHAVLHIETVSKSLTDLTHVFLPLHELSIAGQYQCVEVRKNFFCVDEKNKTNCIIFIDCRIKVYGPYVVTLRDQMPLHLSGIWQGLYLKMDSEKAHTTMSLDYVCKI